MKNTKNGMDRYIPLSGSVHEACKEYSRKVILSDPDDYFFKAPDNGQISPMCIYERYRRYLFEAKISYSFATKKREKNQVKICIYDFHADFFHTFLGAN